MSDISRWDLRSGRVGDNNEVFFMDRSKDGPWVSYGDAVFALDAKDALLREAREVLKRIVAANPRNTNAGSAEQAFSWTYAVAATALAKLEQAQ